MGRTTKPKASTAAKSKVTSIRIDPDLSYRARQLALKNKHEGATADNSFLSIVNAALAEYLKKRGA